MSVEWEATQKITHDKLNKMQELTNFSYQFPDEIGNLNNLISSMPTKTLDEWLKYLISSVEFLKTEVSYNNNTLYDINNNLKTLKVVSNSAIHEISANPTNETGVADYKSFNNYINNLSNSIDEISSAISNTNTNMNNNYLTKSQILQELYPVGTVIIRADNTDIRSTFEPYGVYFMPFGEGQCLFGLKTSNSSLANSIGKTGGNSTVKLNTSNIPSNNISLTKTMRQYGSTSGNKRIVANINLSGGGGNTNNASSFSIIPPYITVRFWKSVEENAYTSPTPAPATSET